MVGLHERIGCRERTVQVQLRWPDKQQRRALPLGGVPIRFRRGKRCSSGTNLDALCFGWFRRHDERYAFRRPVATAAAGYADPNNILQNTAKYPESIIYDTGFPLATKKALCSFIAVRKDTSVVLCTYDTTGQVLTAAEESSMGVALKAYLQQYPESDYYGTPV